MTRAITDVDNMFITKFSSVTLDWAKQSKTQTEKNDEENPGKWKVKRK